MKFYTLYSLFLLTTLCSSHSSALANEVSSQTATLKSVDKCLTTPNLHIHVNPINENNKLFNTLDYDGVLPFSNTLYRVVKNEKYGLIDLQGREVLPPIYKQISELDHNGLAGIQLKYKRGLINSQGNIIIPIEYSLISRFSKDRIAITRNEETSVKTALFNNSGKQITPFKFILLGSYNEGLASASITVQVDNEQIVRQGFIDKSGHFAIEPIFDRVGFFSEGLATAKLGGKWGYIDKQGKTILPFIYDKAEAFKDGIAIVWLNGEFAIITSKEVNQVVNVSP